MKWYDLLVVAGLAAFAVTLFIGAYRSHVRWEREKELDRRYGCQVPKTEVRKLVTKKL